VSRSEPTDLSQVPMPRACRKWLQEADVAAVIHDQWVKVNLTWWNSAIEAVGGGPVQGTVGDEMSAVGEGTISRGDLFKIAPRAAFEPDAALALLWHSVAWGAGPSGLRNVPRLIDSVRRNDDAASHLMRAASLAVTSPHEAYTLLRPGQKNLFTSLGPAFFTKYLYFASADDSHQPCLILDRNVAVSLFHHGWTSLQADNPKKNSNWPVSTYDRYLELVTRWLDELEADTGQRPRADLIERWLFDDGKTVTASQ